MSHLLLFVMLASFSVHARSRVVLHGSGFHLLDSQIKRFLEEAYEGRVSEVKVLTVSRAANREGRRDLRFQIERDGKNYHVACELAATEKPDEIRTRACTSTPSARLAPYVRPLSAFTRMR